MLRLFFVFSLIILISKSSPSSLTLTEHYYNLVSKQQGNYVADERQQSRPPLPPLLSSLNDFDPDPVRVIGEVENQSIIPRSLTDKTGELVIGSNGMLFRVLPRRTRVGEILTKSFVYNPN